MNVASDLLTRSTYAAYADAIQSLWQFLKNYDGALIMANIFLCPTSEDLKHSSYIIKCEFFINICATCEH